MTTAAALKNGHAAKAAAGAPAVAASGSPRAERGHAGASAARAQPPGRDRQDRRGAVFEGVAVSVAVAVGAAEPEGLALAEGDDVGDAELAAERLAREALAGGDTEAHADAEAGGEGERVAVMVEEPLRDGDAVAPALREAKREAEAPWEVLAARESVGEDEGVPRAVTKALPEPETVAAGEAHAVDVAHNEAVGAPEPLVEKMAESLATADSLTKGEKVASKERELRAVALESREAAAEALGLTVPHAEIRDEGVKVAVVVEEPLRDGDAVAPALREVRREPEAPGEALVESVFAMEGEGVAHAVAVALPEPVGVAAGEPHAVGVVRDEAVGAPEPLVE